MTNILISIVRTIRNGPGEINHTNGGLIRYYVEESLADSNDAFINKRFNTELKSSTEPKTAEIHFLIYLRNIKFYFEKSGITFWNIFCAHYKHDGKTSELYTLPKLLLALNHIVIFYCLISLNIFRILRNTFTKELNLASQRSNIDLVSKENNIAINYTHGIDPSKQNDLFLLNLMEKDKNYNCFVVSNNIKEFQQLRDSIPKFKKEITIAFGIKINLIPYYLPKMQIKFLGKSALDSIQLCRKFKLSLLFNPLIFIYMIIFNQSKNAYLDFIKKNEIEQFSNTNFNYDAATISAAAYAADIQSIFKEVSVWGDWSSVHINKVICSTWISLTKKSDTYARNNHLFVDNFKISARPPSLKEKPGLPSKYSPGLKILVIGSNAQHNNSFLDPQHISLSNYSKNLYSLFTWSRQKPDISITIKEKKNDSAFYQNTSEKFKSQSKHISKNIHFIVQPGGRELSDYAHDYDLYIALGTFYPSSLYQLSNYIPKERLIFWDLTKLSTVFPQILQSKTVTICKSEEELFQICDLFYCS